MLLLVMVRYVFLDLFDDAFDRYQPPMLAVVATYWRAWSILLILAAFNPTTIGSYFFAVICNSTHNKYGPHMLFSLWYDC